MHVTRINSFLNNNKFAVDDYVNIWKKPLWQKEKFVFKSKLSFCHTVFKSHLQKMHQMGLWAGRVK